MAQQIIEREWDSFRARVMHPQSPPNQVTEMKNAFYAGALSAFTTVQDTAELPDDEGVRLLNSTICRVSSKRFFSVW